MRGYNLGMSAESDFSDRLAQSRRAAGFRSPREAAQSFGWNENTYKSREGGVRGMPDQDEVRRYAHAFDVDFIWLLTGDRNASASYRVNVMGKIGAGAAILPELEQVPTSGLYEIETPFTVPKGAIAFEVEGDSMWPRYDPGDVIVCWRQGSNFEEVIGWEAAVRTADGHRYLKRILKGAEPETFDLESHNAPPIRGVRLEWVAQVHAVVRADMWKHANPAQRKKPAKADKLQAEQFKEIARQIGDDKTGAAFERAFETIVPIAHRDRKDRV